MYKLFSLLQNLLEEACLGYERADKLQKQAAGEIMVLLLNEADKQT